MVKRTANLLKGGKIVEDREIVALYLKRDEKALAETGRKYGRYCQKIAENILGDALDAQECVNDAYLQAWNTIPAQKPENLSTFLGKLTRNLAINRLSSRTAGKRGGGATCEALDELSDFLPDTESVESEAGVRALTAAINGFLDEQGAKKRILFVRRYFFGESVNEIAKAVGKTPAGVGVALSRMRNGLREYLSEKGFL